MSVIKIGFEYEGWKKSIYDGVSVYRLPQEMQPFIFHKDKYEILQDTYEALSEVRFIPFSPEDNLVSLFSTYYDIIKEVAEKYNGDFNEVLISEEIHKIATEKSVWSNRNEESLELRKLRDHLGEYVNYNLKEQMTFNEKGELIQWKNEHDCRYRGGGLHINISPLEPKFVASFIKSLHERLYPLYKDEGFKSKYRNNILFRYRNYNGIKGVEYISFGINLKDRDSFINLLIKIVEIIKEEYLKIHL